MSYYDGKEASRVVNVLGTEYRIYLDVPSDEDEAMKTYAGYCDNTAHIIAVAARDEETDIDNWADYQRRVIRHELVHAFLFESGLGADAIWHVEGQTHPEQTVDWLARQFPKMARAFEQAGAL